MLWDLYFDDLRYGRIFVRLRWKVHDQRGQYLFYTTILKVFSSLLKFHRFWLIFDSWAFPWKFMKFEKFQIFDLWNFFSEGHISSNIRRIDMKSRWSESLISEVFEVLYGVFVRPFAPDQWAKIISQFSSNFLYTGTWINSGACDGIITAQKLSEVTENFDIPTTTTDDRRPSSNRTPPYLGRGAPKMCHKMKDFH